MKRLSRRQWITAATALATPLQAAGIDAGVVERHDRAVERQLQAQVTDPSSRWCGGTPDGTGIYLAGSAGGLLSNGITAFLQPASRYHGDPALLERIRLAARFLEHAQSPDGNIDLPSTNFNSPPDTGFVVHGVGSAACLAWRAGNRDLLAIVEPFLRKAGAAMARGGVHTPNHRWVVCSALAQIQEVFPNSAYLRRIDQWLAEGIDIDQDGQFTERSTGGYNAICDRALIVTAAKLKRPELLNPVRRNLESMLYLLHPGYEVVTEISRRQDQYERRDMAIYWFPLKYMANHDRAGRYALLADHFAAKAASLTALMEYPELQASSVPPEPVPDNYSRLFPALKVARIRRGAVSATIVPEGDSHFFSYRRGEAVVQSVRFASAFFGKGQFVPTAFERTSGGYAMSQSLVAAYYQPLDPPRQVKAGEWGAVRRRRKETEVCRLEQGAEVTERDGSVRLRLRSTGTANVPVAVEISLREGGRLEGCVESDAGWLLKEGTAVYRVGGDSVRFGPGRGEHAYAQVRGALPPAPGLRVYLCGFTPFEHELTFG